MSKHRERPWTVTKHRPLEKLDDNLWAVEGKVPGLPVLRRMAIVKRSDGTLLFYHAIPLDEPTLREVTAWGKPAYLVIAHDNHGIDAHPFAKQLGLKVFGPKSNLEKMRAKFDVDGALEDIPPDPAVSAESIAGTRYDEPVVTVRSGGGARTSLVFCDAFQNNRKEGMPLFFRLVGFAGPKVPLLFKVAFTRDR
ncbi:MAG: hypothetical protein EBT83_17970, partial [Betaproteobacteria bacterium]|nr:hypothetical protein [Betaproteobacteria bacterium]